MNRRTFLKVGTGAAGSFVLQIFLPHRLESASNDNVAFIPNAFLRIDSTGIVTITIPRPEMGQGVRTSLAMLVADELDCEWSMVKIEQADLDRARYGDQYVGGSNSIADSWKPLREAGAAARQMLMRAAADQWRVSIEKCRTEAGRVIDPAGKTLEYGRLVTAASKLSVPGQVQLKDAAGRRLIGRATKHLDTRDIATGQVKFGLDVRIAGMLYAVVERCPVFGGRVADYDDKRAKNVAGVRAVVRIDSGGLPDFGENSPKPADGVAVVAESTWAAMKGREQLSVQWNFGEGESSGTQKMRDEAASRARGPGRWTYRSDGDVESALQTAAKKIDAVYELPLLAHATMEPMNATVHVTEKHAEVWAPTQNPEDVRNVVRVITGLSEQDIAVHPQRMGGGFGRRFYSDPIAEAVVVSRAVHAPVKVVWTREDDMRHGFYRPAGYYFIRGALDSNGKLIAWSQHLVNASRGHFMKWQPPPGKEMKPGEIGRDDYPAGFIPNLRIDYTPLDSPIPRGQWRAVEESSNVFVNQCFLDELAHAAGKDPLAFQLDLIGEARPVPYFGGSYDSGRLKAVLQLVAERAGWNSPLPPSRGRGIAVSYSNGAYVAQVAEVEKLNSAEVRLLRIVAAVDCGTVVNPSGAEAQVQGSILFALSAALKQEITVEKGRVVQGNFDDYAVVRMAEAPKIEVHFVPGTEAPHGMGEGAVGQTAPAVCNAIFQATGKRIRSLPIRL